MADLITKIWYLKSKGDDSHVSRFFDLTNDPNNKSTLFSVNDTEYSWCLISSLPFSDIIHEDKTDYLLITNDSFTCVLKIYDYDTNSVDQTNIPHFLDPWIIKSDFDTLKVNDWPIQISNPHWIRTPLHRMTYDLKIFISKLQNEDLQIENDLST